MSLAEAVASVRLLLQAMDMQEKRETGEFHIPQPTALYLWKQAKDGAADLIARIDARATPVAITEQS